MMTIEEHLATPEVKQVVKNLAAFISTLDADQGSAFVKFHDELMNCYLSLADQIVGYVDEKANKVFRGNRQDCNDLLFLVGRFLMGTHPIQQKGCSVEECLMDVCEDISSNYNEIGSESFHRGISKSFEIATDINFKIDNVDGHLFFTHFLFCLR